MPHTFHSPLSALMGSTSGCVVGCGCEEDRPVPDPRQVAAWVHDAGETKARKALSQLQRLIERKDWDMRDAQRQVGRTFTGPLQLEAWLREWEQALLAALGTAQQAPH